MKVKINKDAEPWNGLECLFGYENDEWEEMIINACFGC